MTKGKHTEANCINKTCVVLKDKEDCVAQMLELEKENAELKKQVEQKQRLADVRLEQSLENYKLFSDERKERIDIDIALEDMTDQLTKAKEIIKTFIDYEKANAIILNYNEFLKQAEDFIKKVENEETRQV